MNMITVEKMEILIEHSSRSPYHMNAGHLFRLIIILHQFTTFSDEYDWKGIKK